MKCCRHFFLLAWEMFYGRNLTGNINYTFIIIFFYKIPAFEDFNQFLVSCIHKNVFELCKKPPDQKDSNIFLNNAKLLNCFICTDAFVYSYAVGALHLFDGTNHGFKQCQLNRCIN